MSFFFFFFLTIHSALATRDIALMKYLMQTITEKNGGVLFLDFNLANPSAWRSLPSLKNEGNALEPERPARTLRGWG